MFEAWFDRFPYFAHQPSLEPISRLCGALGNPERALRFVHVAGTNGKGSVTTMVAEIAREAGLRVGLYTSPYIVDFHERIRIDGECVSDAALGRAVEAVKPAVAQLEAEGISFAHFDVVTAVALLCFREADCRLICWETGLGGRCDATNVIPAESLLCAVIVPIGLDHCAVLGSTIPEIAGEKAGILKKGCDAVVSPGQSEEAMEVLYTEAARQGAVLHQPSLSTLHDLSPDPLHPRFSLGGEEYPLRLLGSHQFGNAATALEVVRVLRKKGYALPEASVKQGLAAAFLPARLQVYAERPLLLVDGAHNPHGASALKAFLHGLGRPVGLVMGMCADKDTKGVATLLGSEAVCAATVPVPSPRSIAPETLRQELARYTGETAAFADVGDGIRWARDRVGAEGAVVVCGSLYLCGGFLAAYPAGENPFRE